MRIRSKRCSGAARRYCRCGGARCGSSRNA